MKESQFDIQTLEKHEHPDHPSRLGCLCVGLTDERMLIPKEKIIHKVMTVHNCIVALCSVRKERVQKKIEQEKIHIWKNVINHNLQHNHYLINRYAN